MNTTERMTPAADDRPDTGDVLGSAFTGTFREAQAGDEQAFTRLWRDANPLMVRYLRVIDADDPYDAACEGWITAVRGLAGFSGDESAWRVWLLACARQRAEQGTERQRWATVTPIDRRAFSVASAASSAASAASAATAATMASRSRTEDDELDIDALLDSTPDIDPEHRGLGDTVTALRALPLGQGEILVLRLAGRLPVHLVSDIVGSDAETVRRSETRALERLGADAELIAWSLDAPATPAELADERVALGAFRSIPRPPSWSVPRTRVVTVGNAPSRRGDGRHHRGIANAAGRSRTALLGIAAVSASIMSLGGLSAAAYVGALPSGIQQVMSDAIGAPAPPSTTSSVKKAPGSPTASGRASEGDAGVGPKAGSSSDAGQCRAWSSDRAKGLSRDRSVAFRNLAAAAGGEGKVDSYCATVSGNPAVQPTAQVPKPTKSVGKPTKTPATTPTKTGSTPKGTGSPTRTPSSSTVTKAPAAPAPQATRTKAPSIKSTRTKAPGGGTTKTKAPTVDEGTATTTTAPDPTSTTDVTPVG